MILWYNMLTIGGNRMIKNLNVNYENIGIVETGISYGNMNTAARFFPEGLSSEERAKILEEIKHSSSNDAAIKTKYNKQEFLDLRYEQLVMIFDCYMVKAKEHRDLSEKFVNEIKRQEYD